MFVRKIKGYWVLVHSMRVNGKGIQRTKYIGKKLPPQKELEALKKEFKAELNGNRYKYFSAEDIKQIEGKKRAHAEETRKQGTAEREKNLKEFMVRFTYDSSKLSGIQITLRQTSLILKDGIVPKGFKNLKTVKELENHEKGVVAITKYKGTLNPGFIKKLHRILFAGVDNEIAGKLRSELQRNVKIAGTPYTPPKWGEIEKELKEFFKWYQKDTKGLHPLELAALVHARIISLQPFLDGNSRVSRLLMNWVLWKKKYPLVDIEIEDLENYYNALDHYQIEHNEEPFVQYIKKKYLKTNTE
ncbi:MAG: Fic family protein [Candidatus Diapherotrites archaeon]|nr:Fic family protein [Candidatus Diapherotrites archaeon]